MYTTPLSTLISSLSLYHHLYADNTQPFLSFHPSDFQANISHLQNALTPITSWMTSNLLSLNSSKTEFFLIGLKRQLSKIHNSSTSIDSTQSARNLGFIFDEHLSFSDKISALSTSCYHHIRALRCIRPFLDLHTAKTVATSIVHSKFDYCNFLYYGLPKFQINRIQNIQKALARTVVQAPKFQHIAPILKSLHWLKVSERIEYKIISLTYKLLNTTQPSYLYDPVSIQLPHGHNTRSSPYVTLIKPSSSLKVTHRSFRHASLHLWNQLPTSLRIPHPHYSPPLRWEGMNKADAERGWIMRMRNSKWCRKLVWTCQFNLLHTVISFHHSFTVSLWAQNLPFPKILSSTLVCFCLLDWSHGSRPFTGIICSSVLCFSSIFSVLVIPKCGRLSWPALWSTFRRTIKSFDWLIDKQWRRLNRARRHVLPTFTNGWAQGDIVSRTANKKLTKLDWPSRKRSPKRLIVLLEPKSGGARPKNCPHFKIRSATTVNKWKFGKGPYFQEILWRFYDI